jgi:hypothetical protein
MPNTTDALRAAHNPGHIRKMQRRPALLESHGGDRIQFSSGCQPMRGKSVWHTYLQQISRSRWSRPALSRGGPLRSLAVCRYRGFKRTNKCKQRTCLFQPIPRSTRKSIHFFAVTIPTAECPVACSMAVLWRPLRGVAFLIGRISCSPSIFVVAACVAVGEDGPMIPPVRPVPWKLSRHCHCRVFLTKFGANPHVPRPSFSCPLGGGRPSSGQLGSSRANTISGHVGRFESRTTP